MALLTAQNPAITGQEITFTAADVGGDTFAPNPRGVLLVNNADAAPMTVTVANPGTDQYGSAKPDPQAAVADGTIGAIAVSREGFPTALADPADDLVHVSYSAITSVTVAYVVV